MSAAATTTTTKDCFRQPKPCVRCHLYALVHNKDGYLSQLHNIRSNGTTWSNLSTAMKSTVMSALCMAGCNDVVRDILKKEACGVAEVSKTLLTNDRPRQARQIQNKIAEIERQHPHVVISIDEEEAEESKEGNESTEEKKAPNSIDDEPQPKRKRPRKVDKLRRELRIIQSAMEDEYRHHKGELCCKDSAVQELYDSASVSGARARHVREWTRSLKPDFLEFVMVEIEDKAHWRTVADIAHPSPKDFSVPYFLADVHGEPIPDDCFVSSIRKLLSFRSNNNSNSKELADLFESTANKFPQIYLSYLGLRLKPMIFSNPTIIENLARNIPLDTFIWYFEEMYQASRECANILKERLKAPGCLEETMTSNAKVYSFAKFMERIMMFDKMRLPELKKLAVPIAKKRLSQLREKWASRTTSRGGGGGGGGGGENKSLGVLGDASSSMQCAIDTATIFSGFLSALLDGELIFFNHNAVHSPHKKPSSVEQILEICDKVRASGATSLAASLGYFFEKKIFKDAFVLVTDEEENTDWNGRLFAKLLDEYKKLINPEVKLVVVCVGSGDYGFRASLETYGIQHTTVHIDAHRPDLTKFDVLIEQIASDCMGLLAIEDEKSNEKASEARTPEVMENSGDDSNTGDFVMVE